MEISIRPWILQQHGLGKSTYSPPNARKRGKAKFSHLDNETFSNGFSDKLTICPVLTNILLKSNMVTSELYASASINEQLQNCLLDDYTTKIHTLSSLAISYMSMTNILPQIETNGW